MSPQDKSHIQNSYISSKQTSQARSWTTAPDTTFNSKCNQMKNGQQQAQLSIYISSTFVNSGFSTEGTFVSASAASYCGPETMYR